MPGPSIIACIELVARVSQNKKSIRKSEINLEIRNQSLEIRNQVRNHGDLKSSTLFSKVSYPSHAQHTALAVAKTHMHTIQDYCIAGRFGELTFFEPLARESLAN